ncbi:hypothetical protein DFP73DRAFT_596161 [Morchella snyderi]|nr:hypothetical protein DFP73DRAFT_596161 [Morchella snyderi]
MLAKASNAILASHRMTQILEETVYHLRVLGRTFTDRHFTTDYITDSGRLRFPEIPAYGPVPPDYFPEPRLPLPCIISADNKPLAWVWMRAIIAAIRFIYFLMKQAKAEMMAMSKLVSELPLRGLPVLERIQMRLGLQGGEWEGRDGWVEGLGDDVVRYMGLVRKWERWRNQEYLWHIRGVLWVFDRTLDTVDAQRWQREADTLVRRRRVWTHAEI